MLNNKEVGEKLEIVKDTVINYINNNMSLDFLDRCNSRAGDMAAFKTDENKNITFKSYRDGLEQITIVTVIGKIDDEPYKLTINTDADGCSEGSLECDKYGVIFSNVGPLYNEPVLKPFKIVFGKQNFMFASKVLGEITPKLENFSTDIITLTPSEVTKRNLKSQKDEATKEKERLEEIAYELERVKKQMVRQLEVSNNQRVRK